MEVTRHFRIKHGPAKRYYRAYSVGGSVVTGGRRGENENESERQTSGTQTGFRGEQKAGGPETGVGSARVQSRRLQDYIRRSVRRHVHA